MFFNRDKSKSASKSKSAAEDALLDGDLGRAVAQFQKAIKKNPDDLQSRKRLADLYQQVGDVPAAITLYEAVATAYAAQGLMLRAIAACRSILEIDGDNVAATRTLNALDEKRSRNNAFKTAKEEGRATLLEDEPEEVLDADAEILDADDEIIDDSVGNGSTSNDSTLHLTQEIDAELVVSERDVTLPPGPARDVSDSMVVEATEADAMEVDLDDVIADDDDLIVGEAEVDQSRYQPDADILSVPALFSEVPKDAFLDLVRGLQMWAVPKNARIIRQGEFGDSCFLIASGRVRIERDASSDDDTADILGELGEGDVFGEIALLARNQRTANVIATEATEVLEIERALIEGLIEKYPSVEEALIHFSRDRMLQNLLRTAPLFRDLDGDERKIALALFSPRDARMGEELLKEGTPGTGLYVLLTGEVEVSQTREDGSVDTVRSLREGDVFGEMSLFFNEDANATITVLRNAHLMWLAPDDFAKFCERTPALSKRLEEVGLERAQFNAEAFEAQRRRAPDHV